VPGGGKRWDWYRLHPEWAERLVDAAGVRPGELVIDLGAGDGSITVPLAAAGARVIAVELHPARAATLRGRVSGLDVRVVEMDAGRFRYPDRRVRIVANPPFGLASSLIRAAIGHPGMAALDLVLPRQVARRWVADQHRATRRSRARLGPALPRQAFSPSPQVDCTVLQLRRR
jgi:23S rRNA (adenine-N6)-dimethyltransferase